jgi:formylglycine-generating enzyme required for sulfatase activity
MDSCRSKRQILILDCCHSGAFGRGTKGAEQKAVTETTFEGNGFGRVVLTASDSMQYALEGDQVISQTDLSLFTHFLLDGLQTGKADVNNDGQVSLDEWYDYTYSQVLSMTSSQIPHKWSYRQQGDLIIAKNPHAAIKAVELPVDLAKLLESPYSSVREAGVKELGALLHSHDPGLADLARVNLQKLTRDDSRAVSLAAAQAFSENAEPAGEKSSSPSDALEEPKPESPMSPDVREKVPVSSEDGSPLIVTGKKKEPAGTEPKKQAGRKIRGVAQAGDPRRGSSPGVKKIFKAPLPVVVISSFVVIGVIIWVSLMLGRAGTRSVPPSTDTSQPALTAESQGGETPAEPPAATAAITPAATMASIATAPGLSVPPTSTGEIVDDKGISMRLVRAGNFTMGSDNGDTDEKPVHEVYLDDFYIDTYEVTNALYKACVTSGPCYEPLDINYYGNSQFADHPVVYVDWNMALAYCAWRGAQLPTEAQWEKAARGIDKRTYPWGEGTDCGKANYEGCSAGTSNVMTHQSGISPYGVYDMAGNVWEWVADWYSDTYYQDTPRENPPGPASETLRLVRSGAWNQSASNVRTSFRNAKAPDTADNDIGFRCARPVIP